MSEKMFYNSPSVMSTIVVCIYNHIALSYNPKWQESGAGFPNDLRETLTYDELFERHILFNSKKLWIGIQRTLLYRPFMKFLK